MASVCVKVTLEAEIVDLSYGSKIPGLKVFFRDVTSEDLAPS
jgi:hypothetical protein